MNFRDMTEPDFDAAHDAHFLPSRRHATQQYHPLGVTNQGRHEHRAHPVEEAVTETKITDGAHASSELLEDEEQARPMTEDEFGELLGNVIGWSMLAVLASIIAALLRS